MRFDKFTQDYKYKYLTELPSKNCWMTLTIWKPHSRLSVLRNQLFFEKFFTTHKVKVIRIKTRTKIKYAFKFSFDFHENFPILHLLNYKLPEPEIRLISGKYIVTYNFYRFLLEIEVSLTDDYSLQKLIQLFPLNWQNI